MTKLALNFTKKKFSFDLNRSHGSDIRDGDDIGGGQDRRTIPPLAQSGGDARYVYCGN